MRLRCVDQIDLADARAMEWDLIIAASGFEERATFVASALGSASGRRKVALGFSDRRAHARSQNDSSFASLGYEMHQAEGDSGVEITAILTEHLGDGSDQPVSMLIDYSSMTRTWYAAVIAMLRDLELPREVTAYFAYTPAQFSPPRERGPNTHMGPIPGFSGLRLPDQQTSLVVGLGYEPHVAAGLVEYVEASETVLFLASPAIDERYEFSVQMSNATLLRRVKRDRIFEYPLGDFVTTGAMLTSVCSSLEEESRVILAPLGPKPFTLACLLLASVRQGIDVWRVSAGSRAPVYSGIPISAPIIARAAFTSAVYGEMPLLTVAGSR